jgi:hypothetical protein
MQWVYVTSSPAPSHLVLHLQIVWSLCSMAFWNTSYVGWYLLVLVCVLLYYMLIMGYKWYGAMNVSDYAGAEGGMWVGIFSN